LIRAATKKNGFNDINKYEAVKNKLFFYYI